MSYALAFYTVPLNELTARLAAQGTGGDPKEENPEAFTKQAVALLRELGSPVDVVHHSSAGGTWFRDSFIDTTLGGLIGIETAGYLVERPLAGAKWTGYPSMGWLTRDELADAVRTLELADAYAVPGIDDPESEELLELFADILYEAAETGQDVVTVYS